MDSSVRPGNEDQTAEIDVDTTVLDLTSCQLRDLGSVDLPPNLTELDLTANRLTELDPRISQLSNLKKLSLRQNLFNDDGVLPLSAWHSISSLQVMILFFYINSNFLIYVFNWWNFFSVIMLIDLYFW